MQLIFLKVKIFFPPQHSNFLDVYYYIWDVSANTRVSAIISIQ